MKNFVLVLVLVLVLVIGPAFAAENVVDTNVYRTGAPAEIAILRAKDNPDGTVTPYVSLDSALGAVTLEATKGAGATDANTLRITLASDSPGLGGGSSGGLTDLQLRATPVPVSGSLAITNFPATQPVSGTLSIANFPATQAVSGSVSVSNFPATQPVSGTFWQATQPVSGTFWQATQPVSGSVSLTSGTVTANIGTTNGLALDATLTGGAQKSAVRGAAKGTTAAGDVTSVATDANTQALHTNVTNFPATQPVSGTFWQATQPVSLATAPTTPVTGTFWQATQPVSGSVSVSNFPATQPVSGTFWQATQPVSGSVSLTSGTVTANIGTTNGLALDATLTGGAQKSAVRGAAKGTTAAGDVTSVATDANTQALHTNVTNFPATQPVSGTFWQDTQPVSGTFWPATQPVSLATNTPDVTDRAARILGKETKDAGRSNVLLSWEEQAGTANVESALTNFTLGSRGGTALTAATNYTVTSGKTLRIMAVTIYLKATSTVTNLGRFRIRTAASSIANSSPVILDAVLTGSAAGAVTAGGGQVMSVPLPDGLEVAASNQIAFTWLTSASTCTVGMSITGFEY